MSIIVQCGNGHQLSVAEQYRGMRVLCPECRDVVIVPAAALAASPLPQPDVDLRFHVQPPPPTGPAGPATTGPPPLPAWEPSRDERDERPRPRGWGRNDDDDDFSRDRDGLARDPHTLGRDLVPDRQTTAQLHAVTLGLGFVAWRYLLLVFFLILMGILFGTVFYVEEVQRPAFGRQHGTWEPLWAILSILGGLVAIVMLILTFVGSGLCCRVPMESRARGLIVGALICNGAALAQALLFVILAAILGNGPASRSALPLLLVFLTITTVGTVVTGQVLLNLFLRRLSVYVGDRATGQSAIRNMIAWLCVVFGGAVLILAVVLVVAVSNRPGARREASAFLLGIELYALGLVAVYGHLVAVVARVRGRVRGALMEGQ